MRMNMKTITSFTHKNKGGYGARRAGFTLVEAMVAISILSISMTGPLVIAQKGISSAAYSRDQVTAFYLAQEAVEYIRNARDTNAIQGNPWLSNLSNCVSPSSCTIDARYIDFATIDGSGNLVAVKSCPSGTCPNINIHKGMGLYGYDNTSGWTPSSFTRTISILPIGSDDKEAVLSVKVSWTTSLFSPVREFSAKELLFNI